MSAERRVEKIGKRSVDAAEPEASAYRLWDSELKGFGLKVTPLGVKTYFVWYRAGTGRTAARREFTIGRHGPFTPEKARKEAERTLGGVRQGDDPQASRLKARQELTVSQLCDLYLEEGIATKKPSTVYNDRRRIEVHVKPLLGRRPLSSITGADVERFMRDVAAGKTAVPVKPNAKTLKTGKRRSAEDAGRLRRGDPVARGGKGAATRTVGLLGGIFTFAVKRKLRADNPVQGVQRYQDRQSQRFLTGEELKRLATALDDAAAAGANTSGLAVIRLLVLTGARKSEIERLRWSEVDFERSCLRLPDSKTGARVVPLGAAALELFASLPRSKVSAFVFPSTEGASDKPDRSYIGTPKLWERQIRPAAKLPGVRLHDLRHTYASLAAVSGASLPLIGAILGHRNVRTTAQYAHLTNDPVKALADRTSEAAASAMAGKSADVIPLKRA